MVAYNLELKRRIADWASTPDGKEQLEFAAKTINDAQCEIERAAKLDWRLLYKPMDV